MNSKISELDLVSVVDQNDVLPIVNGGITKKVKVSQLEQNLQSVTDKGANTTNSIIVDTLFPSTDTAISGISLSGIGIYGESNNSAGVYGYSDSGVGIVSYSELGGGAIITSLTGKPIETYGNGNNTPSIEVNLGNTNKGVVVESGVSSTGNPIEVKKNGVTKFRVAQNGDVTTGVINAIGDVLTLEASNVQIILDDTGSSVTVSGADFIANQSIGTPLVQAGQYRVPALNTAPASSTATGTLGEIRYTSDFIYVCIATNTWRRTALTSW